mmetsp:Transcript_53859/g.65012  ORF Transcript_53859/g.65012 Transcript_53859/m.65012 type:complete len:148 (-) Transcript_53859:230-673(-)|eukprot:CAMPEP_0172489332 /NCGR_PEP_ID=MMETSP1066-20121228/19247_1 /TAXON_ID=671091 /ORGANISM="Coscinodiscus wailesii, Strain CCMP2513" /LENGTH=147 /DNA_ID=CAMNT_0013257099 /DNA_START=69 /DNA_END=512 /DNA_ORIENTATION=+
MSTPIWKRSVDKQYDEYLAVEAESVNARCKWDLLKNMVNAAASISHRTKKTVLSTDNELKEILTEHPVLWDKFIEELNNENIITNMAVCEKVHKFIDEHKNDLEAAANERRKQNEESENGNWWTKVRSFVVKGNPKSLRNRETRSTI